VKDTLAEILETSADGIRCDVNFAALGLDSMGATSVLVALERRFGVRIPPERLADAASSVDDAVRVVSDLMRVTVQCS
jgi:acyl carrier protein